MLDDVFGASGQRVGKVRRKGRVLTKVDKPIDRREEERLRTRAAILDATEDLMREEGYAAVTSRRVAERAGLKSQLVHYHFGTMDELFLEAYRRNEQRHFARHVKMVKSPHPLQALWGVDTSVEGNDVVSEYISAANHRKVLSEELRRTWGRFWLLQTTMIADQLSGADNLNPEVSPEVLVFLLKAVGSTLVEESKHGFTEGHAEIRAYMTALLEGATGGGDRNEPKRSRRRKPGNNDEA